MLQRTRLLAQNVIPLAQKVRLLAQKVRLLAQKVRLLDYIAYLLAILRDSSAFMLYPYAALGIK